MIWEEKGKGARILEALKRNRQPVDLFPIVKILHLHKILLLDPEIIPHLPAFGLDSHTSESKTPLKIPAIQPNCISTAPWPRKLQRK